MSDTITRLIIQGDDDHIEAFINAVKGDTNLDFYKILPIPFEIKYTIYPVKMISEEKYKQLWHAWLSRKKLGRLLDHESKLPKIGMTISQYDYLMDKYGYTNWCEWSIGTYGTKSGAYHVGEWCIGNEQATIEYTTLWSPASEFYINVSKLFPDLIFKHEFFDDYDVYIGNETIVNGQIIDSNDLIYNCEKAMLLKQSFKKID